MSTDFKYLDEALTNRQVSDLVLILLFERSSRQEGQIGQIVRGAHADLLIVDDDPTRELSMLTEPQRGIRLVMKGGRVYRDKLMDVETA